MRRLFRNNRYASVTATLALFVALGGSSYAAIKLPANSVSTKQIKKGAVTLNRISSGARAALRGQRGPVGPQGPAGVSGTGAAGSALWAVVSQTGVLSRGSHAVDATYVSGIGKYRVIFDRDVSACAYNATLGGSTGSGPEQTTLGQISVARRWLTPDTVEVQTAPSSQMPFYVAVYC